MSVVFVASVSAVRFEQAGSSPAGGGFEAGYEDDFSRIMEQSRQNREDLGRAAERNRRELRQARRELDDELKSRRRDLDESLGGARGRAGDDETRGSEEGGETTDEAAAAEAAREDRAREERRRLRKGRAFGEDRAGDQAALAGLVVAGAMLPEGFKGRLGAALMASDSSKNAVNGYLLTGGGRGTGLMKSTLEKLGSLGGGWKLDEEALPELGNLFVKSGVPGERAAELVDQLSRKELTLGNVLMTVAKADDLAARAASEAGLDSPGGFTASAGGLNNLAQFLSSLGMSTEAVKAVTSELAPGQTFSSYDLRDILTRNGRDVLTPLLAAGDMTALTEALRGMGADDSLLGGLRALLSQTRGGATLDDLLGLMAFSEQPGGLGGLETEPQKIAADVRSLLSQTSKDGELAKTPLFNEIILKLTLLGDRETSDDFGELSPALQALRGGLSALRDGSGAARDGGAGGGGGGGRKSGQDREERLMAMRGIESGTVGRGLEQPRFQSALSSEAAGYASETVARQVGRKMAYSARRGVRRLRMDLAPESLGRLDVELKVENSKLTAFIKADTLEAYEALEKEMGSLKTAMREAGLELALTLSYQGGQSQGQLFARSGFRRGSDSDGEGSQTGRAPDEEDPGEAGGRGHIDMVV
ncbi:MAG: flagellar hook-length control protein FliK [Deltaproteobacteria bacterium]|nr:flagellar hook-length control protein FliK [Deltaproteobacteria bacterium]